MPTVWNASPYDLTDGAGTAILANTTATVAASDWATAAILAGLLVIADGDHAVTTGLGNPAQTQTAPDLALLPPTASDGKTIPAGSDLPVDATHAARTPILPPARVGVVVGYSKVDLSGNAVEAAPHGADTLIPEALARLAAPQTAVRLFGYTGGWVVVPYDRDAITGAAEFTQLATMSAGQVVAGGSQVSGGQRVTGGSHVAGGTTVVGGTTTDSLSATAGATVAGGTTTDTLTVNGAMTASGLVTATKGAKITGGLTADTWTAAGWTAQYDPNKNPQLASTPMGASLIAYKGALYACDVPNTVRIPFFAQQYTAAAGGGSFLGADGGGDPGLFFPARNLGLAAHPDGLHVCNGPNTAFTDLHAANLWATLGVRAETGLSTGGPLVVSGFTTLAGLQAGATQVGNLVSAQINASGNIYGAGRNFNSDPAGSFNSAAYYGGTYYGHGAFDNGYAIAPASSRHLKIDRGRIENAREVVMQWVATRYEWADPERHSSMEPGLHAGLYADEIAESAPEATYPYVARTHNHPDDDSSRTEPWREEEIGTGLEDRALIGYLVAFVQDQQRELDELRARLDAQEAA